MPQTSCVYYPFLLLGAFSEEEKKSSSNCHILLILEHTGFMGDLSALLKMGR